MDFTCRLYDEQGKWENNRVVKNAEALPRIEETVSFEYVEYSVSDIVHRYHYDEKDVEIYLIKKE